MTDLLETAADWLSRQMKACASRTVTYCRGQSTVAVRATIGRTLFEVASDYGVAQRIESRDYLVRAADLVLDGQPTLPAAGDRVREVEGDKTFVYEVMAPGGEPAWRYSDAYRKLLRIHTKRVEES